MDIEYLKRWLDVFFDFAESIPQSTESLGAYKEYRRITNDCYANKNLRGLKYIYKDMLESIKEDSINNMVQFCIYYKTITQERDINIEKKIEKYFHKKVLKEDETIFKDWLGYIASASVK